MGPSLASSATWFNTYPYVYHISQEGHARVY